MTLDEAQAILDWHLLVCLPGIGLPSRQEAVPIGAVKLDGKPLKDGDKLYKGANIELDQVWFHTHLILSREYKHRHYWPSQALENAIERMKRA